ncbi:MAG: MBL fold metallo-hydrolase [Ruminiclostridium sp.]|nr:MBL fold metallo-hydrolase [Ruminiclostridium sp.]
MRIVSLCSSSKANCTYIESGGKGLLVDAGCSYKMLCDGLKAAGRDISDVKAVFVTHEHSDHVNGLKMLTKKLNVPVYASEGTWSMLLAKDKVSPGTQVRLANDLSGAPVELKVAAFRTPHDSAESVCYTFSDRESKIAVCTDLGHVTPEVRENLTGSRFVLLEANYDPEMMTRNLQYPPELKRRIRSDKGHLANGDCAAFARDLVRSGTVSILLGHLSQNNNTPEIALDTVERVLAASGAVRGRDYVLNAAAVVGNGKAIAV